MKDMMNMFALNADDFKEKVQRRGFMLAQSIGDNSSCKTDSYMSINKVTGGSFNLVSLQICDGQNRGVTFKTSDKEYFLMLKNTFLYEGFEYKSSQINKTDTGDVVFEVYRKVVSRIKIWTEVFEGVTRYCIVYVEA